MNEIKNYFGFIDLERYDGVDTFHKKYSKLIKKAFGSRSKHQAWEGGYKDHLEQCLEIADHLYRHYNRSLPFTMGSVVIVLLFHDMEKIWRYTDGTVIDKEKWYNEHLPAMGVKFTEEELNALKYIHGELEDYDQGGKRVMNELAAFCHACDVLSARCFYGKKNI